MNDTGLNPKYCVGDSQSKGRRERGRPKTENGAGTGELLARGLGRKREKSPFWKLEEESSGLHNLECLVEELRAHPEGRGDLWRWVA